MSYNHILVAVDLSESSEKLIEKAVSIAKISNAKLSLIFVDVDNISYVGLTSIEMSPIPSTKERITARQEELQKFVERTDYPIENAIVEVGILASELSTTIEEKKIDLLVCGHHHDFWSRLLSSVNKIINSIVADLLIVYLEE